MNTDIIERINAHITIDTSEPIFIGSNLFDRHNSAKRVNYLLALHNKTLISHRRMVSEVEYHDYYLTIF